MSRHKRIADWHIPLERAIHDWAAAPFEYGVHDCCTFANHCVKALIGLDLMEDHRDYESHEDALRKMHNGGGLEPLVEAACKAHGINEVDVTFAQRGDLCLMDHRAGHNCGVLWLNNKVACAGEAGGIIFLPMETAHRCWRVV